MSVDERMQLERLAARRGHRTPSGPRAAGRADGWRFWATAFTLLVLLTGTNLPTPLYHGYAQRFGFSPLVVTLVFAAYAAVLIPSLLVAGPLSDAVGRRRVLLPAVAVAALGSLGFALATDVWWLFAARVLQGLAIGAASGSLTAALAELEPTGNRRKAALVSTVASMGGLGLGPLSAGLLAQYGPAPYVLPFVLELVLLVPAAAVIAGLPGVRPTTRWRPRRPEIPTPMRTVFATSGTANFLAFAVIGMFLTLVPSYVTSLTHSTNLVFGGGAVALMLACSVVAQLVGYGAPARVLEYVGLPLLAAGLVLLTIAGGVSSLVLLLGAAAIAGTGQGLVFLGGLTAVNHAAPAGRRAEVVSSFYVIVYTGVGLPVIGVGLLAGAIGPVTAVRFFAGLVAALCLVVLIALARTRHRGKDCRGPAVSDAPGSAGAAPGRPG